MSVEKIFEGPVQKWQPNAEEAAAIEEMLASENELTRAYGEAYQNGCWVREWNDGDVNDAFGLTAVGEFDRIKEAELRLGTEINPNEFGIGDCIHFGAAPGSGETRAERVRNGLQQILKIREHSDDSEALDPYASFNENGYRVETFLPKNASQKRQWTIRIYREGEDTIFREETLRMDYEPIFGVDISDVEAIEMRLDQIMHELAEI